MLLEAELEGDLNEKMVTWQKQFEEADHHASLPATVLPYDVLFCTHHL